MANFIPKQFILGNINNGNEYVIEDGLQPKTINDVVEGVAYCDEQRQALVQTPNIVENEGELGIQWINTTVNSRTYKKLQFSNIKGDKGEQGIQGEVGQAGVIVSATQPINPDLVWLQPYDEEIVGTDYATENYVTDEISKKTAYDVVIRTQEEFEDLIASENWLDAKSVALVGQFTLSTPNNSGIKIPATVKQIHGFNGAKITITNFLFNPSTAKGGLWYDTLPTTNDYSIRDLEVDCTGADGYGFRNCTNLTNCTGTATGTYGFGFSSCTNLTNCTGTGTGTGGFGYGSGFYSCTNLTSCTGTGTGTGGDGYGFYNITYASNCKDGGSKTNMWGGTNYNINVETCRKTKSLANNTVLNA